MVAVAKTRSRKAKAAPLVPAANTMDELAEERLTWSLASGLYRTGQLEWKLVPCDRAEATAGGYSQAVFDELNDTQLVVVQNQREMLIALERLTHLQRVAALAELPANEWILYRATRYGRDLALAQLVREQPDVVPEKLKRIKLLANLAWAMPIAELEALELRQAHSPALATDAGKTPSTFVYGVELVAGKSRGG